MAKRVGHEAPTFSLQRAVVFGPGRWSCVLAAAALVSGAGCDTVVVAGQGGADAGGTTSTTPTGSSGTTSTGAPACAATERSSLAGVRIVFPAQRCAFTLAEAAAGLTLHYAVEIAADVPKVVPLPQDAGRCDAPGSSGLAVFAKLEGAGQRYCLCDFGLCEGTLPAAAALKAGSYQGEFAWDGRNWDGPSDTMNPKGAPFPVGSYTLTVTAKGTVGDVGAAVPYEVVATFPLALTP